MRVGTQGLFDPYLKTLVAPFLPTRLTAPGSPRMGSTVPNFIYLFFKKWWGGGGGGGGGGAGPRENFKRNIKML